MKFYCLMIWNVLLWRTHNSFRSISLCYMNMLFFVLFQHALKIVKDSSSCSLLIAYCLYKTDFDCFDKVS